jgi:hypothetical protein
LVAATFTTAAGKKLNGFMIVTTADKKVDIDQPTVLGRLGFRSIPVKSKDARGIQERREFLKAIGQPESKVFPITYTFKVLIEGEKTARQGTID